MNKWMSKADIRNARSSIMALNSSESESDVCAGSRSSSAHSSASLNLCVISDHKRSTMSDKIYEAAPVDRQHHQNASFILGDFVVLFSIERDVNTHDVKKIRSYIASNLESGSECRVALVL